MGPRSVFLFDVDGTLTPPRLAMTADVAEFFAQLRQSGEHVAVVGGSDLNKIAEQLGKNVKQEWRWVFSENGLVAHHQGTLVAEQSLRSALDQSEYQRLVRFCLHHIADLDIPVKTGTFIEYRTGMVNISPVGRNCSQTERDQFEQFDQVHHVREHFVDLLRQQFAHLNLTFSIGGQISFDVFPAGWDKTFCLRFIQPLNYRFVHFFGDKTFKGGNDYEIYSHVLTVAHSVTGPADTVKAVKQAIEREPVALACVEAVETGLKRRQFTAPSILLVLKYANYFF